MLVVGKKHCQKVKRKNIGNQKLHSEINELISILESNEIINAIQLKELRRDTDCVHSDGFYFFDISTYRLLALIEFEEGGVTIIWIGNHQKYESIFKNNKKSIRSWLKTKNWID